MASGALPCPIGRLTISGGRGGAGEMETISASLGPLPPFSLSILPHQIVSSMRSKTTSIVQAAIPGTWLTASSIVERMLQVSGFPQNCAWIKKSAAEISEHSCLGPTRAGRGATVQTGKLRPRELLPKVPRG